MQMRLFLIAGTLIMLTIIVTASQEQNTSADTEGVSHTPEPQKIAACPTFLGYARQLDTDKYRVIPTRTTGESLELLSRGAADFVIAGRMLKPQEPSFVSSVLGTGYSFLALQEMHIQETDIAQYRFVTDLDPAPLQEAFDIRSVQQVDDIYSALKGNIAITTVQRTDYTRTAPVHIFNDQGQRAILSRTPMLYCTNECPSSLQAALHEIFSLSPYAYKSS